MLSESEPKETESRDGSMKRIGCILLALAMVIGMVGTGTGEEQETNPVIRGEKLTMYVTDTETTISLPVYFTNGVNDLPWADLESWAEALTYLYRDIYGQTGFEMSFTGGETTARLTRENGFYMEADFEEKTLYFNDYNAFLHVPGSVSPLLDLVSCSGFNAAGEPELFQRLVNRSFDRYGDAVRLNLGEYGIDMIRQNNYYLIPLQTLGDFTVATALNVDILFNGVDLFLANNKMLGNNLEGYTALGEKYFSTGPADRSPELAEYGYHELCLALDHLYGLKNIHNIDSFAQLFWQINFEKQLSGPSAEAADTALYDLLDFHLDDVHSSFDGYSRMTGKKNTEGMMGTSTRKLDQYIDAYGEERKRILGEDYPRYQEVGNTAYITFDKFVSTKPGTYYEMIRDKRVPDDTIGLIIYAHDQIHRENSPIENVVLDLSNNTGGEVNAAIFVTAWMLGEAPLSVQNNFTGALSTAVYRADVNLDREFDERDTVEDKNLYCLISPVSFSCGNMVPALLKASERVTLLGRTSSGGSCTVQPLTSAWGTYFNISGPSRMSFQKNGSFYDIDQGVDPDFHISRIRNFYDREALTEYINGLF